MSVAVSEEFAKFFPRATGKDPYDYQRRLATEVWDSASPLRNLSDRPLSYNDTPTVVFRKWPFANAFGAAAGLTGCSAAGRRSIT
jgi:hypothetical protein